MLTILTERYHYAYDKSLAQNVSAIITPHFTMIIE